MQKFLPEAPPEFSKLELYIQEMLGKDKIETDRVYKVNKNDLVGYIDDLVKREFVKVFKTLAFKK